MDKRPIADLSGAIEKSLCCVCGTQFHKYVCPRCRARYCSLTCYKEHGSACTESFYRENAVGELQGRVSSREDRQRMRDILERLKEVEVTSDDNAESAVAPEHADAASSDGSEAQLEAAGLSTHALQRLVGDDVDLSSLTAEQAAALHALATRADVTALLQPWRPWWLHADAQTLALSPDGTALVTPLRPPSPATLPAIPPPGFAAPQSPPAAAVAAGESGTAAASDQPKHASVGGDGVQDEGEGGGGDAPAAAVPAPPAAPLPAVASLSAAPPSPLLRHQLLQLLFAYCLCMRLYDGEPAADFAGYVTCLWHVAPSLFEPPADAPLPCGAPEAFAAALERACTPPVGDASSRRASHGVVGDVWALLRCGRGAVVCALCDISRQVAALAVDARDDNAVGPRDRGAASKSERPADGAAQTRRGAAAPLAPPQAPAGLAVGAVGVDDSASCGPEREAPGAPGRAKAGRDAAPAATRRRKRFLAGCRAAERKLLFLQSWANEMSDADVELLCLAAEEQVVAWEQLNAGHGQPPGHLRV